MRLAHRRAGPAPSDRYRGLLEAIDQGFCIVEILVDVDGTPVDYRFLEVNAVFELQTGLQHPVGRTARELVPNLEKHWIDAYGNVGLTGEPIRFVQGSDAMGRWFDVHALRVGDPSHRHVGILFTDITASRRAQRERQRVELELRESEGRFRTFADTAPAMLWATERDGSCSYLSRGWYEFTGQTEPAALGFGWLNAVHPLERAAASRAFLEANARHQPFELEHRLRRRDGAYRWVIDAGRPRVSASGEFAGYVGSVIDIHDRKMAEERLDLAVNSGEVGLWYCDLPFDVLVWNSRVKEHFGLPPDAEVTIDTFYDRMHPDDRVPTKHAIETAIASQATYDTQYRTVAPDGRIRWIRAIGRAHYDDGQPVRFDGITVDVTELMALRDAAEEASRAKDEFLAMLGHELRNPLAPILTALQLLKLRAPGVGENERAIIERQVRHLVSLVDDLLDVSRITRGKIDLRREPVELADVVARAVETSSPLLEQQRHVLRVAVAPRGLVVLGDPPRLAQAVANLLTNAAKYSEPGGTITVAAEPSGTAVALRIRDTGIGIDQSMLPRIFGLFVQEPQTLARSQGGLGLGLAIVRSLVELHGGEVSAASPGKGHGSEFTIRLPLAPAGLAGVIAAAPVAVDTTVPVESTGTRVLVVDDNRDGAMLLGDILALFGYEVRLVGDGPSALAEAEHFLPHVALVDIGLPVMDGYELAQRFAECPPLAGMKLIAVTGYGQARDRQASRQAGFVAHLVKPVGVDELRAAVESVLSPRHRQS